MYLHELLHKYIGPLHTQPDYKTDINNKFVYANLNVEEILNVVLRL